MIKAELLSIGDELLIGQVINTNVSVIGAMLGEIGIDTVRITTVGDNERILRTAIGRAWKEVDVVIATGGLGPTHDDISKNIVAKFFHKQLHLDKATLKQVEARFRKFGNKKMPESNISQALVPDGFTPLRNEVGTAPGLWYEERGKVFVILPGVPHEMKWRMTKWIIPKLKKLYGSEVAGVIQHKVLQTAGVGESALAEMIGDPKQFLATDTTLAFLPRIGGVRLRITTKKRDTRSAQRALALAERLLRNKIGRYIYAEGEVPLEYAVVKRLLKMKGTVATAESCTGGMLAARLTNIEGASAVFPGGVVTYANESKTRDLGISSAHLNKHGAVSEETAIAMAEAVRKKFGTSAGVGITGIAGPSGGSKEKPVGTVWLAIAIKGKPTRTKLIRNPGTRQQIRERSTELALEFLRLSLEE